MALFLGRSKQDLRRGSGLRLVLDLLDLQLLVDKFVDEDDDAGLADIHKNEARSDVPVKRKNMMVRAQ